MTLAITAAEMGSLVFGTLHTNGAANTIDRLIDAVPADEQPQVRTTLAESLVAVVSQLLLRNVDGNGRCAAVEICKTWEDAWASRPIGAFHTGLSFVVAYEFCIPEVQTWIVKSLNSLLDYHQVDAFRWSDEVIVSMAEKLAGEGPAVAFSNVRVEGEGR